MVSRVLIQKIERNSDELARGLVDAVWDEPRTESYKNKLSRETFFELVRELYGHLDAWLRSGTRHKLQMEYQNKGRDRYNKGMPIEQVVFALTLTKTKLLDFVRASGAGEPAQHDLELQLILSISEFFDKAIYHTAAGYSDARMAATVDDLPAT